MEQAKKFKFITFFFFFKQQVLKFKLSIIFFFFFSFRLSSPRLSLIADWPRHTRTGPRNLLLSQSQLQHPCSEWVWEGFGGCAQCPVRAAQSRQAQMVPPGVCQGVGSSSARRECARHGTAPRGWIFGIATLHLGRWARRCRAELSVCSRDFQHRGQCHQPSLQHTFTPKSLQKAAQELGREPSLLQAINPIILLPLTLSLDPQGLHPPSLFPGCPGDVSRERCAGAIPKLSPCSSQASPCSS